MKTINFNELLAKYDKVRDYLLDGHKKGLSAELILYPSSITTLTTQLFPLTEIKHLDEHVKLIYGLCYIAIDTIYKVQEVGSSKYSETLERVIRASFEMSKESSYKTNMLTFLYENKILIDEDTMPYTEIYPMSTDNGYELNDHHFYHTPFKVIVVAQGHNSVYIYKKRYSELFEAAIFSDTKTYPSHLTPTDQHQQTMYLKWLSKNNIHNLLTEILAVAKDETTNDDILTLDLEFIEKNIIQVLERLVPEIPNIRPTILAGYNLGMNTKFIIDSLLLSKPIKNDVALPEIEFTGY